MALLRKLLGAGLCAGGFLALCHGLVAAGATVALAQEQSAAAPKDTIFARKILMDSINHNMDELEDMARSGQPIDLADAHEHADTISVMLMAFPHLFPPATNQWRPDADRDPARDTFASPDVWTNYADFYARAAAASKLAYRASRANQDGDFKSSVASLRTACDSCHAAYLKTDP
jgi:cytochrome c556